jgi:hypothetical protein
MRATRSLPDALHAAYPGLGVRLNAEPRPFPGFRVGQVWALMDGRGEYLSVVQLAAFDAAWRDPAYPAYLQTNHSAWFAGGVWIEEVDLLDFCRHGILLADAVCPHLAPWASALPVREAEASKEVE